MLTFPMRSAPTEYRCPPSHWPEFLARLQSSLPRVLPDAHHGLWPTPIHSYASLKHIQIHNFLKHQESPEGLSDFRAPTEACRASEANNVPVWPSAYIPVVSLSVESIEGSFVAPFITKCAVRRL